MLDEDIDESTVAITGAPEEAGSVLPALSLSLVWASESVSAAAVLVLAAALRGFLLVPRLDDAACVDADSALLVFR